MFATTAPPPALQPPIQSSPYSNNGSSGSSNNTFTFSSPTSSISTTSPPTPRYRRRSSFAPLTPSPLRESRNAQNLPLLPSIKTYTPFSSLSSPIDMSNDTPTENLTTSSTTRNSSTSAYHQKSRSQSPATLLSMATSSHATARRALFRDRGRRDKEGKRWGVREEQALRLDWLREERAWEERMRRSAARDGVGDEEMSVEDEDQDEDGGLGEVVPEEVEMEELEERYRGDGGGEVGMKARSEDEDEDEDWDQVFMGVLSTPEQSEQVGNASKDGDGSGNTRAAQDGGGSGGVDVEMT